ncbi:MAG: hypothetical protein V3U84_05635 [Thiotrichaceae bacterium]
MDQGKKSFLALVFVFVAPVVLGSLLFFNKEKLGISSTVNYGELIVPAKPTLADGLMRDGKPAKGDQAISKRWTMLYIEPNECDSFCMDRLLLMKRVRLLLNEEMRRVRTTFVSPHAQLEAQLKKDYPDLNVRQVESASSIFIKQFPQLDKKPIYLLDPLGNMMMLYPDADPDYKFMIKDIKRLLKYSRVG